MDSDKIRNEFILNLDDMPHKWQSKAINAFEKMIRKYDMSEKETGIIIQANYISFILQIYLKLERTKGRPEPSVMNYELTLNAFFAYCHKEPAEVTSVDVVQFLCDYKDQRGVSYSTLNDIRSRLCAFFSWALKTGYCNKNPVDLIPKFKEEKKQREYLTGDELEELRASCFSLKEIALIEFLVSTACRISEVCNIRLSDINWRDNTIKVIGKGKKQRTVIMTPKCRIAVDEYLASRGYGIVRHTETLNKAQIKMQDIIKENGMMLDKESSDEYLFQCKKTSAHPDGAPTQKNLRSAFDNVVSRTSFKDSKWITPHTMRHTWATLAKNRGMKIEDISAYLGHESISTTMIYITIDHEAVCNDVVRYAV